MGSSHNYGAQVLRECLISVFLQRLRPGQHQQRMSGKAVVISGYIWGKGLTVKPRRS